MMNMIPDEMIERVRDTADIVDVVGESVELRRTGADYRGPCPFHGGKHRNLAVIPKKQMFYCFVCHEGGDVFTYYMKRFGMDYPQAVREVASKVGIEIAERSTGGPDPHEPLYTAVAAAAEWYARQLREASEAQVARTYLEQRQFELEAMFLFGLGFAPKGGAFLEAMQTLGIVEDTLLEAGLAMRRDDGSVRPRFWGRLLFPIHDLRGRVVGFGGRVLGDGEPKYLNSPDNPLFHKGQILYNLHAAKLPIRRAERAVVVEGYFDVLRAVEAGFENVVAPLGTALTPDQARLLKRYTREVVLLYDSDQPGMKASFRAADELLRCSVRALIATPPTGEDPDTLVLSGGKDALATLLDDAIDVFDRKLQLIERKGLLDSISGRRKALDRLLPSLRATEDPVMRDLYVARTAEALGISRDTIQREMHAGRERFRGGPSPQRHDATAPHLPVDGSGARRRMRDERHLVRVMVHEGSWRGHIKEHLTDRSAVAQPERELLEQLGALAAGDSAAALIEVVSAGARLLLEETLAEPWSETMAVDELVEKSIKKIEGRSVESAIADRQRRLHLAPDEDKLGLLAEITDLSQKANRLNENRWGVTR